MLNSMKVTRAQKAAVKAAAAVIPMPTDAEALAAKCSTVDLWLARMKEATGLDGATILFASGLR